MCLSLDLCLLSILVKLIDLVNSVIISYDLTQIVNFPTQIPDCHSHSLAVLDFFFLLTLVFVLQWLSQFWSCCCLSFHWLSIIFTGDGLFHCIGCDYSCADWDGLCDHFLITEMFCGRISLNSVLLLLLVNFVSGLRLELMYLSLIESIRSSFTLLHGFQVLVLLP